MNARAAHESPGDSGQHPLKWAATRGTVMRTVYGKQAVCPPDYPEDSLAARCWRWGLNIREAGRAVSRETTGKRSRRQPRWSPADKAALGRLLEAGFKHGEAAKILGRSYEGVEGQLKALRKAGAL